ncbi:uncharacterized protein BX664DRAFT_388218 [Halteromyces radiatus]|uniref:uncharacterized protein n=1 Tax=Halteromyces radiatus TaxID=101107 RepID=UPI00221FB426|nr:uncharacterized protein BX664DRAFT_388218 [Halteromyces radiatus]KAI8083121.1 hypothetical protein BX664DRAFT_388218 [Halteromyces radiatus]
MMKLQLKGTLSAFVLLCYTLTVTANPTSDPTSLDLPIWALVVMAVVVGLLIVLLFYFVLRRYLSKRRTVDTIDQLEKHTSTNTESTVTMESLNKPTNQVYKPAMIDQEKMTLPFPPPSTSLFSDKMELNSDDAMQLFERYMQTERTKGGFTTLDLDMPQLVNTVQQKVGTIKSTLRQSIRRQKSKSRAAPVHQMFDSPSRPSTDLPRPSLSEISRHTASSSIPSSSSPTPPYKNPTVSPTLALKNEHNNIVLDQDKELQALEYDRMINNESPLSSSSPSASSPSPSPSAAPESSITNTNDEDNNNNHSDGSAIHAARRVIRSASRKSKTRSMLVNDEAVLKMFNQEVMEANGNNRQQDLRRASIKSGYTTVSGRSTNANSTRYLTNDILGRRASTLGKSYQKKSTTATTTTTPLEGLFNSPSINTPASSSNEKVEVTQVFDGKERRLSTNDRQLTTSTNSPIGSSKYAVPDDNLLHPNQRQKPIDIESSAISNKKRTLASDAISNRRIMQERMDNFEGLSAHTESTGHSRKSSGSAATMVRISQQQPQTWSCRAQSKRAGIPHNLSQDDDQQQQHQQQQQRRENTSTNNNNNDNKKSSMTFYTVRSTRSKQRTGIPSWCDTSSFPQDKTPAERERDQYLKTLYGNDL